MTAMSGGAAVPLRLLGVPLPADPRRGGAGARRQGTLALELVPAAPPAPPSLAPADDDDEDDGATGRGLLATCLPDPERWAAMIAQAVVEILVGRRPVAQVVRWVDAPIYERVRRSAQALAARGTDRTGTPVRVRRVRLDTHDCGVEAVVVVDDGRRCRALALRLDAIDGRWLCTALDIV